MASHHFIPVLILGQAASTSGSGWIQIMIWGGALIGVILVGGAAIMLFRRHVVTPPTEEPGIGFTLDDLRQLKEKGELSDAEYETARRKMAEALRQEHELDVAELSIKDLRDMLEGEEITPEQFMALRKQVVERLKGRPKESE